MGTWGYGIIKDDTVADVISFVTERLKAGDGLDLALAKSKVEFSDLNNDEDDGPLFWLALAHLQWKYGKVDTQTLERVRSDIENERGLARWRDTAKDFARRKEVLTKFLAQLESPNPRISALPKMVFRKAPFKKGDCLSVLLPDSRYTAALVLGEDNSNPELGMNLIASLDYLENIPPSLDFFKCRKWLILSRGNWNNEKDICWYLPVGFQQARKRIEVIGNIATKWLDPRHARGSTGWINLGTQILRCRNQST